MCLVFLGNKNFISYKEIGASGFGFVAYAHSISNSVFLSWLINCKSYCVPERLKVHDIHKIIVVLGILYFDMALILVQYKFNHGVLIVFGWAGMKILVSMLGSKALSE